VAARKRLARRLRVRATKAGVRIAVPWTWQVVEKRPAEQESR
jgi:hypothetical protein